MANKWGTRTIILDTACSDTDYVPADDAKNEGAKYSTLQTFIQGIRIEGASNGQTFTLQQCPASSDVENGTAFLNVTVETGDLNYRINFPKGMAVDGIYPKAIPAGRILIDLI